MRYVAAGIFFVLFSIFSVPAQARVAIGTNLTILIDFDQDHSESSIQEMNREIEHLLRRTGVRLSIREKSAIKPYENFEDLVMVKLQGSCKIDGPSSSSGNRNTLGWSHVMSGEILPFGDVSCDNVRGAIQGVLGGSEQKYKERMFGRALGRVVAHELYHIIGGVHTHGRKGIAQASLSGHELITEEMELAAEDMERMVSRSPRIFASRRVSR